MNNTDDFPALQFVWTDRNNKFPWETGFAYRQPLPDRNADFNLERQKILPPLPQNNG
jgi:hypothetical protein